MEKLKKVLSEQQYNDLLKLKIEPWVSYQSIIIRKNNVKRPIYMIHSNLPSIIEQTYNDEVLEYISDDYVVGDYVNDPIIFNDLTFSDLTPTNDFGDILLFTIYGVFELTNAKTDDVRLFYDDVIYYGDGYEK